MPDAKDTASISFTGLYTGEVFYRSGLSPSFLATRSGGALYHLMTPMEMAGKWLGGANLRLMLVQRHLLMDDRLEYWIRERGVTQVLEIASGMSPRGLRFRKRFPDITYVETDLPGMAERKRRALEAQGCLNERHRVCPLNVFHEEGPQALETVVAEHFRQDEPLLIITEGLTSYFTLEAIRPVWQRINELGQRFPGSAYLFETYWRPGDSAFGRSINRLSGVLGRLSDSKVSFHFDHEDDVQRSLGELGFSRVKVHDPRNHIDRLRLPAGRGDSLVRVVEAELA